MTRDDIKWTIIAVGIVVTIYAMLWLSAMLFRLAGIV